MDYMSAEKNELMNKFGDKILNGEALSSRIQLSIKQRVRGLN